MARRIIAYPGLSCEIIRTDDRYVWLHIIGVGFSDEPAFLATTGHHHRPLINPHTQRAQATFCLPLRVTPEEWAETIATDLLHNIRAFRLVRGWGDEGVLA